MIRERCLNVLKFSILITIMLFVGGCSVFISPLDVDKKANVAKQSKQLEAWLDGLVAAKKFNGSVLVQKNNKIVLHKQYGYTQRNQTRLIDRNTAFNLASVSKQFTAFAILLLHERGKLQLDAPIANYLPDFPYKNGPTVRQLIHHQANLKEYFYLLKEPDQTKPVNNSQVVKALSDYYKLKALPTPKSYQYSNTGYVLLASIVESLSGQSFEQFMAENIFMPMGLKRTRVFNLESKENLENRAIGYKRGWLLASKSKDLNGWDGVTGDGAVYTTAEDLLLWFKGLKAGTLMPFSQYKTALQNSVGQANGYGFGWVILGRDEVEHSGGWQGHSSYFYLNFKSGDVIVLLDNASHSLNVTAAGTKRNSISLNLRDFVQR